MSTETAPRRRSGVANVLLLWAFPTLLALGSVVAAICFWPAPTDSIAPRLRIPGNGALTTTLAFSHDGKILASGDYDGVVRLRDAQTGSLIRELRYHKIGQKEVYPLQFSDDDLTLIAGDARLPIQPASYRTKGPTLVAWSLRNGAEVARFSTPTKDYRFQLSADGTSLRSVAEGDSTDGIFAERSLANPTQPARELKIPVESLIQGKPDFVEFSPDRKTVVAGAARSPKLVLIDIDSGKVKREFPGRVMANLDTAPVGAKFSADGNRLAIYRMSDIEFWDLSSGKVVSRFRYPSPAPTVFYSSLTRDGSILVLGTVESKANLLGRLFGAPLGFFGSPLGTNLTGKITLVETKTGQILASLSCPRFVLTDTCLIPDGSLLAVSGAMFDSNGTYEIRVWRISDLIKSTSRALPVTKVAE